MLTDIQAIVLAAGKATRLNTNKTKLIEKICGQELIIYPLSIIEELSIPITLVVGFKADSIKKVIDRFYPHRITYVEQAEQTGTASATKLTRSHWNHQNILIMKADIPLITPAIIRDLYQKHIQSNAVISFVAAHHNNPSDYSYSRIIQHKGRLYIRKRAELSMQQLQKQCCINGGIYLISRDFLNTYIDQVKVNSHTYEFHLSDLVNLASFLGKKVSMVIAPFDQVRGINTYQELWAIEQIKRAELIRYWMERGVRFSAAQSVHIDLDVEIGAGSFIGCSVHLLNKTQIGKNSIIGSFSIIDQAKLGNHITVHSHSIIRSSTIDDHVQVGPFAHVQSNTHIGTHSIIGNFVETKRTSIGNHSKAKHLSYLGDTQIGSRVNIGAGTITCNYNGKTKHITQIEDNVFIGSNNSLIAPVIIQKDSFTAAGSVITHNVPQNTLAIARAKQINKEGYTEKSDDSLSLEEIKANKAPLSFIGATKSSNDAIIDQ